MAKPSWITVVSGSTGSGSGTRSLKASSHTGRSSRSGSIKGVTSGGASDSVVLLQVGAGEFIRVDKTFYSVAALGDTVKITGTSNSPSLKLTNLTDSSLLSNFALKVNGTAYSWDGNVSHQISGDPGASSSYTFEISFDVAENQTEYSKNITFRLRDSSDPGISSEAITIIQAAGEKTYGTASVYMTYSNWNIGAEGGVATPSYGFSIPWGWNGKTSGGGTLTQSNSSHSVKYTYYTDPPGSPYNWTLDEHTGEIVMDSLGKNITDSYESARIKITIIVNGQTLTHTDFVRQDPNKVTYTLSSASVSLDDIPASGGSADSPNFISASGKIDYSSGESDTPSIISSDVIITLSKTVNGSNLGSTIKARTKLDTVTATITWNGSSVTQSIDVYQQANQVTYSDVQAINNGVPVSKRGGDVDIVNVVGPYQKATYTSGAIEDITDFSYTFTNPSWITVDELTLKATVGRNITGSTRDGEIKVGIEGKGHKSTTASIQIHQESMVLPTWSLGETETYTKDSTGITFTVSDPDNVGYSIEVSETWMVNRDNKIQCMTNLTGSSRTGTVQLIVAAGATVSVIATCTITQESKILPSWDVPSTFHFDSLGQSESNPAGLEFTINNPDNLGWTIDGPSYVTFTYSEGGTTKTANLPFSRGERNITPMYIHPDVNGTAERTFDLSLLTSSGAVIATCVCTQDASESGVTWDLPSSLTFEGGGDGAIFTITDKDSVGWRLTLPDWCLVSDGITEGSGDRDTDLVARANDTGSSRTGTVQLVSTDGNTVYATCTVTQEADTSLVS